MRDALCGDAQLSWDLKPAGETQLFSVKLNFSDKSLRHKFRPANYAGNLVCCEQKKKTFRVLAKSFCLESFDVNCCYNFLCRHRQSRVKYCSNFLRMVAHALFCLPSASLANSTLSLTHSVKERLKRSSRSSYILLDFLYSELKVGSKNCPVAPHSQSVSQSVAVRCIRRSIVTLPARRKRESGNSIPFGCG